MIGPQYEISPEAREVQKRGPREKWKPGEEGEKCLDQNDVSR